MITPKIAKGRCSLLGLARPYPAHLRVESPPSKTKGGKLWVGNLTNAVPRVRLVLWWEAPTWPERCIVDLTYMCLHDLKQGLLSKREELQMSKSLLIPEQYSRQNPQQFTNTHFISYYCKLCTKHPKWEKMPITKEHVKELSGQTNGVIWLIGTLINILFVLNSMICLSFFLLKRKLLPWHKKGVGVIHNNLQTNKNNSFNSTMK